MKKNYKIFTLVILAVFIMVSGFGCKGVNCTNQQDFKKVTIQYWGVWDSPESIMPLIKEYEKNHPTIKVEYKQLRFDEYERKLLEAWADDRGPDVFALPISWLKEYQHRLEPMPSNTKVPVYEIQGAIKSELITTLKTFNGLAPYDINQLFVPIVDDNVVLDNRVYGLPYALDTLVTFYNSNILSKQKIPEPIKDFHDLVEQTPKITTSRDGNSILQSAVALGGTDNIPVFFDIFSSIMLQNEVLLKGDYFNPLDTKESSQRLSEVFNFYTDFARPGRASYSWNDKMDNAFDLFVSGRLAYFFGYSYHANEIRNRGVSFEWGITNFPQARGTAETKYYADYWVNVVSKKSTNKNVAWNFVQTTATDKNIIKGYLTTNKKPTALRSLVNEQLNNADIRVFAEQVLTADNWYKGYDQPAAVQATKNMIDGLLAGTIQLDDRGTTLELYMNLINKTYTKINE